jgi:hypothetical protein
MIVVCVQSRIVLHMSVFVVDSCLIHPSIPTSDHSDIRLGRWFGAVGGGAVCVLTGEVLVTDTENHRLVSWRIADGGGLRVVCGGVEGSDDGQFKHPVGVVVSRDGALWVADCRNHRLCLFR